MKKHKDCLLPNHPESKDLVQWLSLDLTKILKGFLMQNNKYEYYKFCKKELEVIDKKTNIKIINAISKSLTEISNIDHSFEFLLKKCKLSKSDSIRSIWALMIGYQNKYDINTKFSKIKFFAKDSHFMVREFAWISLRNEVSKNIDKSIKILTNFSKNKSPYIRRFSCEITRPRGVWCKHINFLKTNPQIAFTLLNNLKNDDSLYVQNSVANWLNDLSKNNKEEFIGFCKMLIKENCENSYKILKKAMRNNVDCYILLEKL